MEIDIAWARLDMALYRLSLVVLIAGCIVLLRRQRHWSLYLCLIGFIAHLAGGTVMMDASSQIVELRQTGGDLDSDELLFMTGKLASSLGFIAASLGFLRFAFWCAANRRVSLLPPQ
jgi:hypothetical protein